MTWDDEADATQYQVVTNHEEVYSIWPTDRPVPLGWRPVGKVGSKAECLAYIEEVWTDMRPLSLRKALEEQAKRDREA
ncbi:MAG: MbtH family NRPS accessory protein [Myxococcales bacterium]|nr:MbtH family NRPS accessory protein [Myxococcales bacterium]MCB9549722.1 MbtH family NRPS accessory protein [Myxococcales bacterium]